jgi:hypothetical protein
VATAVSECPLSASSRHSVECVNFRLKMKNLDDLIQSSDWRGIFTRTTISCTAAAGLYWLPIGYAWYSEVFLSKSLVINERGRSFEMGLVGVMLGVQFTFEAINGIRVLLIKRRAKRNRS